MAGVRRAAVVLALTALVFSVQGVAKSIARPRSTPMALGSPSASKAIAECKGHALIGLALGSGAGLGNLVNVVGVVNMGTTSCRLGGYPGLEGTRHGHAYPVAASDHGTYFGNLNPTVLAPRMVGSLLLATEDGCPALNQANQVADRAEIAAHTYTGVVIELPLHGGSVVVNRVRIDTACGLQSSRLGWRNDLLGDDLISSR